MSNDPNSTMVDFTELVKEKFTMRKDIAPVETSTTASQAYTTGKQFYLNDILREATTDIAQGDTLTLNTNYKNADPVTTSIQNLSNLRAEMGAHNLFNFDAWADFILANSSALIRGSMTKSGNSVTITATSNDCYTRHGNSTYYATKALIPVKAGQKYTFEWETDSTTSEGVVHVFTYDSSFTQKSDNTANDTVKKISITVPTDAVWLEIRVGVNTSGNSITYSNFIVRRTEDDSGYQPYSKTNRELTEDVTALESQINADTGLIKGIMQVTNETMNIYCTNNEIPDWGTLTATQATDIAQGIYDFFKKIGGEASIYYIGTITMRFLKASDGTPLGSNAGLFELYSNTITYNAMLSDNTKSRMLVNMRHYGNTIDRKIGLWGKYMTVSVHGVASNGAVSAIDTGITHNTISTYKG